MNALLLKIYQKRVPLIFFNILLFLFCFYFKTITYSATEITLQWDYDIASNPDIDGFKVYMKESTETDFTIFEDLTISDFSYPDNTAEFTITGLIDSITYEFAVTAYDDYGRESEYSNIVSTEDIGEYNNEIINTNISISESGGGCFISSANY